MLAACRDRHASGCRGRARLVGTARCLCRSERLVASVRLPLFEFARINRIPMVALNVDASLTRAIDERGREALPDHQRQGVGRPALASEAYLDFLITLYRQHAQLKGGRADSGFQYFVEAQQNWEHAMAEALVAQRVTGPQGQPPLVVGIIGSGHLRFGFGVPHQLRGLGVDRVTTLLPLSPGEDCREIRPGLAGAVFTFPKEPATPVAPPRLGSKHDRSRNDTPGRAGCLFRGRYRSRRH